MSFLTLLIRERLTIYLIICDIVYNNSDNIIIVVNYLATVWSMMIFSFNTFTVYSQYTQIFKVRMLQEHVCKAIFSGYSILVKYTTIL